MTANLIDGRRIASHVRAEVGDGVARFAERYGRPPGLATVLVGQDAASQTYVSMKHRACDEVGIRSLRHELDGATSEAEVLQLVANLAADDAVDGILVQQPLPSQIDTRKAVLAVPPSKDVDGFHPQSVGAMLLGHEALQSCTPAGVMRLLDEHEVELEGRNAVVVGRSNIVGKPVAMMLLERNATVTVCHSRTRDLAAHTRQADVLVVAVGRARLITGEMIKPGATVIDVGMNRDESGLVGDVDFESAREVAGLITPVPGGVGPMTIATLMHNTLIAAQRRLSAVQTAR